ncbi:outer membrane protein OmpA [Taylorella equigenitalis]|uniref:Outer membrane protein A n=3 Tax=Taylorella equigenitalis TaxID=29575 RepID=A0A654KI59_TAYEM|nr:OmpA family protein [Taylorella equigenitalis]ADU92080.1 Outer membrane protein A precursor [Taylorella equigenitalis MCE9]AFN35641.1 outer membrane protein A [Taylorella equigenitalis ATCC 35865]ASY30291.1 hypothetical protein B9Z30_02665 [Taylorella equigenitalis]ASY39063.1 OmpA family protein [Taylorella equigenitalis]ASY40583.1 hypothetical protein CAV20_02595 [Taylorella equigenitalis]
MTSKFALAIALAFSAGVASAQTVDNWVSDFGDPVVSDFGDCWQNDFWTPATALPECGGVTEPSAPAAQPITANKVTFNADTFFDFDKSSLKPEGRTVLDQIAEQVKLLTLESLITVGHTDSIGTNAYNQKLSERRAATVKNYLIDKGVPAEQIIASGRGETQPIADNRTREGRAQNRRVDIEMVGTPK